MGVSTTPEYIRNKTNTSYRQIRAKVIEGYGSKCCKCGFSDERALQIDHINGGGSQETKVRWKGSIRGFLYWLVKNNFPTGYQLLCANCNVIKRIENQEWGNKFQ